MDFENFDTHTFCVYLSVLEGTLRNVRTLRNVAEENDGQKII